MPKKDNLTFLQKAALDGEIAFAIATSNHNDEVLFRMYSILSSVEKNLYSYVLESFEEMGNLPEDKIQRVRAELALNKVPVWIWENKCVSDIKECIKISEQTANQSSITADQKKLKMKIVTSAFIFFTRKIAMLSTKVAHDFCIHIMNERGLESLNSACTYLLNELEELQSDKKITKELFKKLLDEHFDIRETLSYRIETKALLMMNKNEENLKYESKNNSKEQNRSTEKNTEVINFTNQMIKAEEILSSLLNPKSKDSTDYVVKKVFYGSNKVTTLETFKSKAEAEEFIEDIIKNMPELLQTCTFIIEHQIK